MPGIDLLISRDLSLEIKNHLDQDILKKLEKKLFFEYGMSIKLSIDHFEKFHRLLKDISNIDAEKFEKDCIKKIIQVSKTEKNYNVKIINQKLSDKICDFFGDSETRKILVHTMKKNKTVSQILKNSGVLKSPLYRKIENLLLDGMILESGKILTNNKRVSQYTCIFDEIQVHIRKNDLVLEGIVNSMNFNNSSIAKLGLFEN